MIIRSHITTFNALGQPTTMTLPNSMVEAYAYDTDHRLTKKELKTLATGGTVVERLTFGYETSGNIDYIAKLDGLEMYYDYDKRYRLTKADRMTDSDVDMGTWTYNYDDADNLLTKVAPFGDDFADGNLTGWTVSNTR